LTGAKHPAGDDLEEDVDGLTFYRTPVKKGLLARAPVAKQAMVVRGLEKRLEQLIPTVYPSLLHAHSPALNGVAALRVGRRNGIPVVYEVRAFWEDAAVDHGTSRQGGLRFRLTRGLETYVLRRAQAVTVICEGLRGDITARGIDPNKITVIPNAVDCSRFRGGEAPKAELAKELGLEGKEVVGFIGSFYAYEGLSTLIKALLLVSEARPALRLLLVGGGHYEEGLKEEARRLGVSDKIVFAGRVPHEQIAVYYDLTDVLVYPRLPMRLTELVTPLKPLEAMARGKIVVASDVGGHRELIRDGKTGYLFEAGNIEALAERLSNVLQRRSRWPTVIEEARRFVETERNWRSVVERYRSVYETVTQGA
jgi:PEP-CTERM/exosortase A-associated glycosyltransferase